jgi:cell division FtsZ-interacting protein ZapD
MALEADVREVRLNNRIREFVRQKDLLKIEAINRNLMIKKLIDKVDEDLGAVSFILGSIKETEIKTDFLIKEQEEDIEKMKEQYKNF